MNEIIKNANEHLATGLLKVEGLTKGSDRVIFYCKNGAIITMYHQQNCCECVDIDSVDSEDYQTDIYTDCKWCVLEEMTSHNLNYKHYDDESYTWTFYNVKTSKGYDTIRWYGTSNGYYSESVDIEIYDTNAKVKSESEHEQNKK